MIRKITETTFNKSVVNRAEKSPLIDEIADILKQYGISAEAFLTCDPSFTRPMYWDLGRRSDFAFSAKRLDSILNTVHRQLLVAA